MDILNQFGINPLLLAAQVVNFFILLWILNKFLYGPILKILETRKKTIAQSLKNADEIERRLKEIGEREAEAILKSAREGEKIIKQAGEYGDQIIDDAKVTAQNIVEKGVKQTKLEFEAQKQDFEQSLRENVVNLVMTLIQKITNKILNDNDRKKIIEESIKSLRS